MWELFSKSSHIKASTQTNAKKDIYHDTILSAGQTGLLHGQSLDVGRRQPLSASFSYLSRAVRSFLYAARPARAGQFRHAIDG